MYCSISFRSVIILISPSVSICLMPDIIVSTSACVALCVIFSHVPFLISFPFSRYFHTPVPFFLFLSHAASVYILLLSHSSILFLFFLFFSVSLDCNSSLGSCVLIFMYCIFPFSSILTFLIAGHHVSAIFLLNWQVCSLLYSFSSHPSHSLSS
jgi:hypothetical protein